MALEQERLLVEEAVQRQTTQNLKTTRDELLQRVSAAEQKAAATAASEKLEPDKEVLEALLVLEFVMRYIVLFLTHGVCRARSQSCCEEFVISQS
jgi:hypothetical protein